MKKIILILLLMLIWFVMAGETEVLAVSLPELMKPHSLAVDESQIYIADNEGAQEWELYVTGICELHYG
jgi:hypothetical protein